MWNFKFERFWFWKKCTIWNCLELPRTPSVTAQQTGNHQEGRQAIKGSEAHWPGPEEQTEVPRAGVAPGITVAMWRAVGVEYIEHGHEGNELKTEYKVGK